MTSYTTAFAALAQQPLAGGWRVIVALLVLNSGLWGCASTTSNSLSIKDLPPLQLNGGTLIAAESVNRVPTPDLLALDEPMRQFVRRYTTDLANGRQRLLSLHEAVRGAGALNLQYEPFADGTAQEAFHRGAANCLSYASLLVAMAREAGLTASYHWQDVRPQWSRVSDRIQLGLHVNVMVTVRGGTRYLADIDPLPSRDITGSRELTDRDAEALYNNNIAMAALGNNEVEQAWLYVVRALQLSPEMSPLWVNLGAIYRFNGQLAAAEQSYQRALDLDFQEYSAMTNLAILYRMEGRQEEREYWLDRVDRHRQSNPYYHAWQGEEAVAAEDWTAALDHYDRAVGLAPSDSQLLFARALVYYQLRDLEAAALNLKQAIELATLRSEIDQYQFQLDKVREAQSTET